MTDQQQSKLTAAEFAATKKHTELQMDALNTAIVNLTAMIDLKLAGIATGMTALDDKLYTATKVQGEKVLTATASLDHRLEEMMNQIHKLEDQTNLNSGVYLTKVEHFAWKSVIEDKLSSLHDFETIMRTKASNSALMVSFILSGVLFIISVINFAISMAERLK